MKAYSHFLQEDDTIHFLEDTSPRGKKRDWKGKKQKSLLMEEHFRQAGIEYDEISMMRKADRMQGCCDTLTFRVVDEKLRLYQAWFCKVRLCPMCNWRRSLKIACQNKRIVEVANEKYKLRWLFLTLTLKNCEGDQLKNTVNQMMTAWNRFIGYKRINNALKGYFRALEITKNRDHKSNAYGTYHPHLHILFCVSPSYFKGGSYIPHKDWQQFWKKAMRLDYDPIIHIQRVKPKEDCDLDYVEEEIKQAIREQKAIQEVSKYPIKDTDILPKDKLTADGVETVYTLDSSIAYKRLIGYGGILKEIRQELKLDDGENGNLVNVDEKDEISNAICEIIAYWHVGLKNYIVKKSNINT